jgi:hypothetical protein
MEGFASFLSRQAIQQQQRERDEHARREGHRVWSLLADWLVAAQPDGIWISAPPGRRWGTDSSALVHLWQLDPSLPDLWLFLTGNRWDATGLFSPETAHAVLGGATVSIRGKALEPRGYGIQIAGVLAGPRDLSNIRARMKRFETAFIHEFAHYIDFVDSGRPLSYTDPTIEDLMGMGDLGPRFKRAYYNEPAEVRAFTNEMLHYFEAFWRNRDRITRVRFPLRDLVKSPKDALALVLKSNLSARGREYAGIWQWLTPENRDRVLRAFADYLRANP